MMLQPMLHLEVRIRILINMIQIPTKNLARTGFGSADLKSARARSSKKGCGSLFLTAPCLDLAVLLLVRWLTLADLVLLRISV